MASVRARLEESNSDDGTKSSSVAAYSNFCSVAENLKSVAQNPTDFEGELAADNDYHPADSEAKEQSIWHRVFRSRQCKYADITVTVLIVALVWMMMALPTVIYIRTMVRNSDLVQKGQTESNVGTNVTCTLYKESQSDHCTTYLKQYTNCLRDSENDVDVYISGPLNLTRIHEANHIINKLRYRSPSYSVECSMNLEPFICLHHVHLCDKERGMAMIAPSRNQCAHISYVCDEELKKLKMLVNVKKYLSTCGPESPLDSNNCSIVQNNSTLNCSTNFFYKVEENACKPECDVWTPHPKAKSLITDIVTIFPSTVGAVTGVIVLLLSCAQYRKLCRYPSIFVIYQTIPAIVVALLILTGYSARKRLFCSSKDLIESFHNPTTFCTISGIIFYYTMMQQMLWWLWHTIAVFLSVSWPFHTKKFIKSKKHRYLHVTFVLASLLLPIAPTLVVMFVTSKPELRATKGFSLTRSPPIVCTGVDLNTNFWAVLFPMSLVLATATSLLIFILRIVIKNRLLSKLHNIRMVSGWILEFKVLLVLCYYVIIGAVVLTIFTHNFIVLNDDLDLFNKYFSCESEGLLPNLNTSNCTDLEQKIQETMNPVPTVIAVVIIGFLPAVNLVYVVKFSDLKSKMKTYSQTRYVQYIQNKANRAGRYIPYLINEWKSTTLRRGSYKAHTTSFTTETLITPQVNIDSHI